MEAGRELDVLVATKVMGYQSVREYDKEHGTHLSRGLSARRLNEGIFILPNDHTRTWSQIVPPFSTDIAAAWQVVEKIQETMRQQEKSKRFSGVTQFFLFSAWDGETRNFRVSIRNQNTHKRVLHTFANTAPLAICLVALQAVGVQVE